MEPGHIYILPYKIIILAFRDAIKKGGAFDKTGKQAFCDQEVYSRQIYMYDNNTHSVTDYIVSINQPYIRPIVVKGKATTEFGGKLDISIDDNSMARIEKQFFDIYNDRNVLIRAIECYLQQRRILPGYRS